MVIMNPPPPPKKKKRLPCAKRRLESVSTYGSPKSCDIVSPTLGAAVKRILESSSCQSKTVYILISLDPMILWGPPGVVVKRRLEQLSLAICSPNSFMRGTLYEESPWCISSWEATDGVTYHKSCFKCSHCKGTLVMSNYSSLDGVLYCKPHFEQLFKESGDFRKNFQTGSRQSERDKTPNKLSSLFSGTQDKCPACNKTVYPLEKITMEGESYHKSCFKCAVGGCPLTHSSYAALDGILYCKHHFQQLFMEKGNYSHVKNAAKKNQTSASEAEDGEAPAEPASPKPNAEEPEPESEPTEAPPAEE